MWLLLETGGASERSRLASVAGPGCAGRWGGRDTGGGAALRPGDCAARKGDVVFFGSWRNPPRAGREEGSQSPGGEGQ